MHLKGGVKGVEKHGRVRLTGRFEGLSLRLAETMGYTSYGVKKLIGQHGAWRGRVVNHPAYLRVYS